MSFCSKIQRDKLLHAETSALIVIVAGLVLPWWIASIFGLSCGIAKELWDTKHGVASWSDLFADLKGVLLGTVILLI